MVKTKTAKFIQFAVASALMAKEDAKLNLNDEDPYRIGSVVGSGSGGSFWREDQIVLVRIS